MEVLLEQSSLLFSSLQMDPRTTHPPALPPIQHEVPPLPQTWQDTSFDLAWGQQA